jgi:hypothetical protein
MVKFLVSCQVKTEADFMCKVSHDLRVTGLDMTKMTVISYTHSYDSSYTNYYSSIIHFHTL